jgi:hypothetical protein
MSSSNIEGKRFLEELKARRAKLDAAISAIEEVIGEHAAVDERPRHLPGNLPYRGMTTVASAILLLKTVGKPMLTADMTKVLREGGVQTNSKNFYRTLYNTLNNRLDKEMTKVGGKWGLKEWEQKKVE